MISATLTATPRRRAKPRKSWTPEQFGRAVEMWSKVGHFNMDLYRQIQIKKAQQNNFVI